jgi:hypothetical protein
MDCVEPVDAAFVTVDLELGWAVILLPGNHFQLTLFLGSLGSISFLKPCLERVDISPPGFVAR